VRAGGLAPRPPLLGSFALARPCLRRRRPVRGTLPDGRRGGLPAASCGAPSPLILDPLPCFTSPAAPGLPATSGLGAFHVAETSPHQPGPRALFPGACRGAGRPRQPSACRPRIATDRTPHPDPISASPIGPFSRALRPRRRAPGAPPGCAKIPLSLALRLARAPLSGALPDRRRRPPGLSRLPGRLAAAGVAGRPGPRRPGGEASSHGGGARCVDQHQRRLHTPAHPHRRASGSADRTRTPHHRRTRQRRASLGHRPGGARPVISLSRERFGATLESCP
jgi:hypothetical protein